MFLGNLFEHLSANEPEVLFDSLVAFPDVSESGNVIRENMLDWELSSISSGDSSETLSDSNPASETWSEILVLIDGLNELCLSASQSELVQFEPDPLSIAQIWKDPVINPSEPSLTLLGAEALPATSTSSGNIDFSGFSNQEVYGSETSSRHTKLSQFLGDLSRGLSDIRGVVMKNRRASLERVKEAINENPTRTVNVGVEPNFTVSPPHVRSRGQAMDLPNVMDRPIERKKKS